ncbi:tape measure protein [Serratia fonticola]|uniref:tape measure protein n=1 Tax=Serratia fonticola TaxID=47917 RepID=UPI003AAA8654
MASEKQVGNIIYQVQMDVNQLLTAQRQVNGRLDRLEGGFDNTTRAVNNTEKSMLSLSGVAKSLAAALSVQQVAKYAEAWTVVNNKLVNSIKPHEELGDAVNRVFNLAQSTRTELDATASLYSRLERATRQAGTSTEDLAKLTTIINQAFIVSGAAAQEAESAIIQLSQGLASGTLRGEEYNSVNEQGNRLIVALSESLGVGAGKLREMAFAGKLTTDVVVNGLLKQGDAIGKEFANTVTTMGQAFSVAKNNITKFVGESATVKSVYAAFNDSIVTLSENLSTIATVIGVVGVLIGGRFVGALTAATAAQIKHTISQIEDARAAREAAVASELEAQAKLNAARADKAGALSSITLAEAKLAQAKATDYSTVAAANNLLQEEANSAADLQSAKSTQVAAAAELALSDARLAAISSSALEVTSEMQLAAARVNSIKVNIAQLESEKALEIQRLKAQISEKGRIATATRMAEVQRSIAVLNGQLAAAEQEQAAATQAAQVTRANAITAAEAKLSASKKALATATDAVTAAQLRYNEAQVAAQLSGRQAQDAARIAALASAERALSAARTQAATATDNYNRSLAANAAAQERSALAARAASASMTLLRGSLALVGGPVGAAMIAAAAVYYFYQRSDEAKKAAFELADGVNALVGRLKELSSVQIAAEIAKAEKAIRTQSEAINDQREKVKALIKDVRDYQVSQKIYGESKRSTDNLRVAQEDLAIETEKLDEMERQNSQTKSAVGLMQAKLNGELRTGIDLLKQDGRESGVVAGLMSKLGNAINFASRAKEKFNATSLNAERSTDADKLLKKLKEENELLNISDKRLRAITEARQKAVDAGAKPNSNQLRQIEEEAGKHYDLAEAEKNSKKEAKESASASKKAAGQAESVAQKLENLKQQSELAAASTQELSREQAMLRAEQSLGVHASEGQIKQARDYAAATWDTAAAIKARNAVPELKENADYASQKAQLDMLQGAKDAQGKLLISQEQYNQQSVKLEQDHITALAKIRADQTVNPQQQAAAQVDPVQALANENAQKLALIKEFTAQKVITEQQGLALMNAANKEYEAQRTAAQWQLLSQQSLGYDMLTSAVDAFSGNASNALTGLITGSMSAEEAMRSLGSTMLNSVVNSLVQVGVEALKNFIIAQTIGAAGQTAAAAAATAGGSAALAAWTPAAIAASIATMGAASGTGLAAYQTAQAGGLAMSVLGGVSGARKNGGPVNAGSMYQVGEGGRPELLQAGGKQYMIPGDNGKVISNKDMQSGGGAAPTVIINNYSSAAVDARATQDSGGGWTIEAFIADMNNGGQASQAITANTTARRVPRGQG